MCKDGRFRQAFRCSSHEATANHQRLLARLHAEELEAERLAQQSPSPTPSQDEATGTPSNSNSITDLNIVEDGLRNLLHSFSSHHPANRAQTAHSTRPASPPDAVLDWNLYEATEDTELDLSAEQQAIALISQQLLDRLNDANINSDDDDDEERSDEEPEPIAEPVVSGMSVDFIVSCTAQF